MAQRGRPRKIQIQDGELPPEATKNEVNQLSFKDLREIAIRKGISVVGKTKKELQLLVGQDTETSTKVDLGESLTPAEIEERRDKQKRIPGTVRYFDKDEENIWKVWEKNPEAFDGMDLTDEDARIKWVFDKKVKCKCGEEFPMWRQYKVKETLPDGEKRVTIKDDKESMGLDQFEKCCPKCGVKYIYIDPERVPEVAR